MNIETKDQSDYLKYRGKCKEMCEEAVKKDPSLTMVRGHYYDPLWNREEPHWWTVRKDGTIFDPSARQFPTKGMGEYTPFSGICTCVECGKEFPEEQLVVMGNGNYTCCSNLCAARLVGAEL